MQLDNRINLTNFAYKLKGIVLKFHQTSKRDGRPNPISGFAHLRSSSCYACMVANTGVVGGVLLLLPFFVVFAKASSSSLAVAARSIQVDLGSQAGRSSSPSSMMTIKTHKDIRKQQQRRRRRRRLSNSKTPSSAPTSTAAAEEGPKRDRARALPLSLLLRHTQQNDNAGFETVGIEIRREEAGREPESVASSNQIEIQRRRGTGSTCP